jgi:hypothetical protein
VLQHTLIDMSVQLLRLFLCLQIADDHTLAILQRRRHFGDVADLNQSRSNRDVNQLHRLRSFFSDASLSLFVCIDLNLFILGHLDQSMC